MDSKRLDMTIALYDRILNLSPSAYEDDGRGGSKIEYFPIIGIQKYVKRRCEDEDTDDARDSGVVTV